MAGWVKCDWNSKCCHLLVMSSVVRFGAKRDYAILECMCMYSSRAVAIYDILYTYIQCYTVVPICLVLHIISVLSRLVFSCDAQTEDINCFFFYTRCNFCALCIQRFEKTIYFFSNQPSVHICLMAQKSFKFRPRSDSSIPT